MTQPFKTITPLLWRGIVFLGLFVLISGAIGPRIISGGIMFNDGFAAYGGIGKAMIFGLIAFTLLVHHSKTRITLQPWRAAQLGWLGAALLFFGVARGSVSNLLANDRSPQNLISAHLGLLLCVACAAIGCVGWTNMRLLWQRYRREIVIAGGVAILFYAFLLAVYAIWRPLASLVLTCVKALLDLTGVHATVMPPNVLVLDKFGITVAQYCSGIESIALFSGLYAIVGLLDWGILNKRRYFGVFPFALLVLCLLNVLRVYGLILAGYYINPQIAFSLFHTYAGLVFFILYSAVFWTVAYKRLLQKDNKTQTLKGKHV